MRATTRRHPHTPPPLTRHHHTRRWDSEKGRFVAPGAAPHPRAESPSCGPLSPRSAAPKVEAAPTAAGLFRGLLCGFERKQVTSHMLEDWIAVEDWVGLTNCAGTRKPNADVPMRRASGSIDPTYTLFIYCILHTHYTAHATHITGKPRAAWTRLSHHLVPAPHHRHHRHHSHFRRKRIFLGANHSGREHDS